MSCPQSSDLTTLDAVKSHLRIQTADDDSLILDYIHRVSEGARRFCNRVFHQTIFSEWHNLSDQRTIALDNYPIEEVIRVARFGKDAFSVRHTDGTSLRAVASTNGTALILRSIDPAGTDQLTTLDYVSYPTTSLLVDAVNGTAGWEATLSTNVPSMELARQGGMDAAGGAAFQAPETVEADYRVDHERGFIEQWWTNDSWLRGGPEAGYLARSDSSFAYPINRRPRFQRLLVEYIAGYQTIPGDIEQAAIDVVQQAYNYGLVDPTVGSERLGDYQFTVNAQERVELDDMIAKRFRPHRRPPR